MTDTAERPAATLAELLDRRAAAGPVAHALIAADETVTFAALAERSRRAAEGLAALGVGVGDRVALWLPNLSAWLELFFACVRLGAIVVAVNTRFRSADLSDALARSGARVLAFAPGFRGIDFPEILAEVEPSALARLQAIVACAVAGAPETPARIVGKPVHLYAGLRDRPPLERARERAGADVGCALFTTSGTTAAPKFVLHVQRAVARHAHDVARGFGYRAADTCLLQALPLCGIFGFSQAMAALAAGRPSLLPTTFEGEAAARSIARGRVTHFNATDGMVQSIFEAAEPDELSSIRQIGFAAFANPEAEGLIAAGDARGVPLVALYGMSELHALFARRDEADPPAIRARAGGRLVAPEARVRARDPESRQLLPPGEPGALEATGPSRFAEYFEDEAATAAAITQDGFVRTGDLGAIEEGGGFRFLARMGDSLRLGGYLVAPREIEAFLETHPAVDQAQVVGAAAAGGTRPVAFVIPAGGGAFDEAAVVDHCASGMARFKVPARVVPLDAFPVRSARTASRFSAPSSARWRWRRSRRRGKAHQARSTRARMKRVMAARVASGWSRWGEWPHFRSTTASHGPAVPRSTARTWARVPYLSSAPWITMTGQAMPARNSSRFQARKSGSSQLSAQP